MFSIPKVRFANFTDKENITGATIFVFDEPLLCSADKRGGAQTTRQIDSLLHPHISLGVDALFLSGGSAFGLNSASGVVEFLKERGVGFGFGKFKVPRVPSACIFDLTIGNPVPPSPEQIYKACLSLSYAIDENEQGSVGAGTGATVGKLFGVPNATKGGLGIAWSERNFGGVDVKNAVFAVVNAFGNIIEDGKVIAGVRKDGRLFDFVEEGFFHPPKYPEEYFSSSTVIVVGFSEGVFSAPELWILAQALSSAVSHTVKPAHTPFDGDISFAVSCGMKTGVSLFDVFGEFYRLAKKAILNAVKYAESLGGVPSYKDIHK